MEGRQPVCWPPLSAWLMRCPLCGPEAGEKDLWPHESLPVAGLGAPDSCSQDPLPVLSRALQLLEGLEVDQYPSGDRCGPHQTHMQHHLKIKVIFSS